MMMVKGYGGRSALDDATTESGWRVPCAKRRAAVLLAQLSSKTSIRRMIGVQ